MSGLRILGGLAKGRILKTLKEDDLSIRPLLGRIKKSLFDILQPKIAGAEFLDLYAGTGAVGLEALSRGARHAVLVELSPRSLKLIRENAAMLGWSDRAEIHQADVTRGLAWLGRTFDIVFMGPPYRDAAKRPLALTPPTLEAVASGGLLDADSWLISQHHEKEPVSVPPSLFLFRREKYGDTILSFYRLNDK